MHSNFFKYITPLRILFIFLLIVTLLQLNEYTKVAFSNHKNGFTGIGFVISAIASIVILIVDVLLSYFLNPKKNWISQVVVILLFLIWLMLF